MLTRRAVILAKVETGGYGVDLTPAPATDAILAYNPKITPVSEKIARDPAMASLSKFPSLVGKRYYDLTFSTDLKGSGTNTTPPRWGVLLEALGFGGDAGASDYAYLPISAEIPSITIYAYFDGSLHIVSGAVGVSCELVLAAGGIGKLNWTFRGLYSEPTVDGVPDDCEYDPTVPEIIENTSFSLADVSDLIINQLSIVITNDVAVRGDISSAAGVIGMAITGRTITGSFDPEALSAVDIWGVWSGSEAKELSIVIGVGAGNIWTITAPKVTLDNIDTGDREGIRTFEIPLSFGLEEGDDELKLVQSGAGA